TPIDIFHRSSDNNSVGFSEIKVSMTEVRGRLVQAENHCSQPAAAGNQWINQTSTDTGTGLVVTSRHFIHSRRKQEFPIGDGLRLFRGNRLGNRIVRVIEWNLNLLKREGRNVDRTLGWLCIGQSNTV